VEGHQVNYNTEVLKLQGKLLLIGAMMDTIRQKQIVVVLVIDATGDNTITCYKIDSDYLQQRILDYLPVENSQERQPPSSEPQESLEQPAGETINPPQKVIDLQSVFPPKQLPPPKQNPKTKPKAKKTPQETKDITDEDLLQEFNEFWKRYPKKKAKQAALRAWMKLKPSYDLIFKIWEALDKQKASYDWKKDRGKFIPYPATWLNQGRWEDKLDVELED